MFVFAFLRYWYVAVILALVIYSGLEHIWRVSLQRDMAVAKAARERIIRETQEKADSLANELIVQQAIAMGKTQEKVTTYVDRIRYVQGPDTCSADERMRIGSAGVRDIITNDLNQRIPKQTKR